MNRWESIRVRACGVFRRGDEVLLIRKFRPVHYLLPGGGTRYGEPTEDAVRREMHEELDVRISEAQYVGMFESLGTTIDGLLSHGISVVYEVATDAKGFYEQETVTVRDETATMTAVWVAVADVPLDTWDVGEGLRGVLGLMTQEP